MTANIDRSPGAKLPVFGKTRIINIANNLETE